MKEKDYPHLDITFIPSLILDMAKLNKDPFYQANSLIRRKCHGQMNNCLAAKSDNYIKDLLESYRTLITRQLDLEKNF
jgi:hypothetical protein